MQAEGQIVDRIPGELVADVVGRVAIVRLEIGRIIVPAAGGVALVGIVIIRLSYGVLKPKLETLAGVITSAERRAAIHGARRAFTKGNLPILRQGAVSAGENVAAVRGAQCRRGQVVIAVALQVDGVDVVELGANHPSVSDFPVHTQAGLEGSRIYKIVGGAREAGLQERIRRSPGYLRDGLGGLVGSKNRQ